MSHVLSWSDIAQAKLIDVKIPWVKPVRVCLLRARLSKYPLTRFTRIIRLSYAEITHGISKRYIMQGKICKCKFTQGKIT